MKLWDIIAFFNWLGPMILRFLAKVAALFVVPFLGDEARKEHSVFGVHDATDLSWKNIAWRNGAHNCWEKETLPFDSYGDEDMEAAGFKKRFRRSRGAGSYISFRVTFGKPDKKKGKDEVYVGWTMNDDSKHKFMRPTFQCRPAWLYPIVSLPIWGPVVGVVWWLV